MSWASLIKLAIRNFQINKKRAFLTMLGIVIGVSAVVIIMSAGAGAQSLIINEINSFGSNLFAVMPGVANENGPPPSIVGITVTTLKLTEVADIAEIPHIEAVTAYVRGMGTLSYGGQKTDTTFVGTSADLLKVENLTLATGRFFDKKEVDSLAQVIVLGHDIKNDLFGEEDALGKFVKLKKQRFRVIGVLDQMGNVLFENKDTQVYIPITTAQKKILGINHVSLIRGKIDDVANTKFVLNEVTKTIRQNHHIKNPANDDFTVRSLEQALNVINSVTDSLRFFLAGIAAISLLVGGIGIMNIMLVNVTERTKEIGLRKAVGATYRQILEQFLIESASLTLLGGLAGLLLGVLIAWLIAIVVQNMGYNWDFIISPRSILLALSVSVLVGVAFGLYPAQQAAKLEPVEALRNE